MEKVMWLVLGATVIVASLLADRSNRARLVARVALGVLFLVFGALVNVIYLVTDWDSFAAFGEMSQFAFVRDTWASLVVPNTGSFIGALIAGEATAGILVLSGGRRLEAGLVLLLGFHVGLLFFGWWLWLYAVPMLGALTLLLRAQRRHQQDLAPPRHGVHRGSTRIDTGRAVRQRSRRPSSRVGGPGDGRRRPDQQQNHRARRVAAPGPDVGPAVQGRGLVGAAVRAARRGAGGARLRRAAAAHPGGALLEYIAAHQVIYLTELVCFVGLAVPALVVFIAVAVALKDANKSIAAIGGLFGIASEVIALALGSSPSRCTAAWSCSATPTRRPVRTPTGPAWSVRRTR